MSKFFKDLFKVGVVHVWSYVCMYLMYVPYVCIHIITIFIPYIHRGG